MDAEVILRPFFKDYDMLISFMNKRQIKAPLFYLLSYTWGAPITVIGCIYALFFVLTKHEPKRFGYCCYFESKRLKGAFNVGTYIFTPPKPTTDLLSHEHGHALQNCLYGMFMPFLVAIPSCLRYHYRRFMRKCLHKKPKTTYDSIWFENEATIIGNTLYNLLEKKS